MILVRPIVKGVAVRVGRRIADGRRNAEDARMWETDDPRIPAGHVPIHTASDFDAIPFDDIDPGVRRVVRWLNQNGFVTCDSGDGESKRDADGVLPEWANDFPHVVILTAADDLTGTADRLWTLLIEAGINADPIGPEDDGAVEIQASYDPAVLFCDAVTFKPVRVGHIFVSGLRDNLLPPGAGEDA